MWGTQLDEDHTSASEFAFDLFLDSTLSELESSVESSNKEGGILHCEDCSKVASS